MSQKSKERWMVRRSEKRRIIRIELERQRAARKEVSMALLKASRRFSMFAPCVFMDEFFFDDVGAFLCVPRSIWNGIRAALVRTSKCPNNLSEQLT